MSTSSKKQMARHLYDVGYALFQENRFEQALAELKKSEDAFRRLDARGRAFHDALPDGISGLANTLYLEGLCCEKLGEYAQAITCYETSLINAPFEKAKRFRSFLEKVRGNMLACYEKEAEKIDPELLDRTLSREPELDIEFRFPFSLSGAALCLARLYELSPERHARFRDFYVRARDKNNELARMNRTTDESVMKRMSVSIWVTMFAIWTVYALIVVEALFGRK